MTQTQPGGKIAYDVNENPPVWMSLFLGFTHVALIFDAIVFIPNIIGKTTGIPPEQVEYLAFTSIIIAAIAVLIQTLRVGSIGCGYVLFAGSYSAFLVCSLDAVNMGGLPLMAAMGILAAPMVFLYAYFLRYLRHIVTPVIGGTVIMLVAMGLIPIGLDLWMGGDTHLPSFGSGASYLTGTVTIVTLMVLMITGNRVIRLWTPIIGMGIGYLTAWSFGLLELTHFHNVPLFGLPQGHWPSITLDLEIKHLPLATAFLMVALVSAIEGTGNIMLVQKVSERDFHKIRYDRVQGGLFCDGLAKLLAGAVGTTPNATYCDNIPLMEMTGVASRRIGICGAAILLCAAFMPKIGGLILDMPPPVVGGILMVIAAMLFYAGISLVQSSGMTFQKGLIMGFSLCAGLVADSGQFFPNLMPVYMKPLLGNGVAVGGFSAFFLNTLMYVMPKPRRVFSVPADMAGLTDLMKALEGSVKKLKLTDREYIKLQLACEEAFLHMISHEHREGEIILKINRDEDVLFVELISGAAIEDIDQIVRPPRSLDAGIDEMSKLGLLVLQNTVMDLRHIQISGYAYISFFISA